MKDLFSAPMSVEVDLLQTKIKEQAREMASLICINQPDKPRPQQLLMLLQSEVTS